MKCGVLLEKCGVVTNALSSFDKNKKKNPFFLFDSIIKLYDDRLMYFVNGKTSMPDIGKYGLLFGFVSLFGLFLNMSRGFNVFFITSLTVMYLLFIIDRFVKSDKIIYLMLKKGLRKKGYNGIVQMLSNEELLSSALFEIKPLWKGENDGTV